MHFKLNCLNTSAINYKLCLNESCVYRCRSMARNTTFNLAPMLEREKLAANGGNYGDWIRTLRLVLRSAKKEYVLDQPLGDPPAPGVSQDVINVFISHSYDYGVVFNISC